MSLYTPEGSEDRIELAEPRNAILDGTASAARAGDLVYVGGQVGLLPRGGLASQLNELPAPDGGGLRFLGESVAAESRYGAVVAQLLAAVDNVRLVLGRFDLGLDDLVHVDVFLRDAAMVPVVEEVLADRLPESAPTLSMVEVPWLPVHAAEVMLDGIAFAP
jgi:enamine deaminase RidA (YjgF/YER057c/UK114 family)